MVCASNCHFYRGQTSGDYNTILYAPMDIAVVF